jgi:hypothetical protein
MVPAARQASVRRFADLGEPMRDRRSSTRQKSFLQGRIYYNNRRSSVDCLVRDISDTGAKLIFSGSVSFPDVVDVYLSNKDEVRRARVQWRRGDEAGVDFVLDKDADVAPAGDLLGRVLKLESECASLKRAVRELRAEMRKLTAGETV